MPQMQLPLGIHCKILQKLRQVASVVKDKNQNLKY